MKNLQRLIFSLLFVIILSTVSFPCCAEPSNTPAFKTESQITPRSDETVWIFKNINGRLYRRLYNATQNRWIGDWELVG